MPIFKVTTTAIRNAYGQYIEPGMSVEISTPYNVIMLNNVIADQVQRAFMAKYGVDLKMMNCLSAAYLKVEKKM